MKILVIQLRRIGDIILTTPIPSYLKKAFPSSTIDFLCEPMGIDVLKGHPDINEVVVYDREKQVSEIKRIRSRRYDAVIDFLNNPRTAWISGLSGARYRVAYKKTLRSILYNVSVESRQAEYASIHKLKLVQAWLTSMGQAVPPPDSVIPKIYLTGEEEKFAKDWMRSENVSPDRFVVMAPIHRHPIRQWRVEGYRGVGQKLAAEGFQVYLSYGPGEESAIREVQRGADEVLKLLPLTSLRKVAALYSQAKLMVTNDSGAMHLAVAAGTPTVTIYGPTEPTHLTPPQEGTALRNLPMTASGVSCLGCELSVCSVGHLCMTELKDDTVLKACLKILGRPKPISV